MLTDPRPVLSLSRSTLAVLAAVLELCPRRGICCTMRQVAAKLGWPTATYAVYCLRRLERAGLIRMDAGKANTIRPACRFISAVELEGKRP